MVKKYIKQQHISFSQMFQPYFLLVMFLNSFVKHLSDLFSSCINQKVVFLPSNGGNSTCLMRCCFPVFSCRATAKGHRYPAVQPTRILPADATWRYHGQHKGWKQLILWVCVFVCFQSCCVILIKLSRV